jgi:hypothetical protein
LPETTLPVTLVVVAASRTPIVFGFAATPLGSTPT